MEQYLPSVLPLLRKRRVLLHGRRDVTPQRRPPIPRRVRLLLTPGLPPPPQSALRTAAAHKPRHALAEAIHLTLDDPLLPLQRARPALQAPLPDLALLHVLALQHLGQGVGEVLEGGDELLVGAAALLGGGGGLRGGLLDLGEEG